MINIISNDSPFQLFGFSYYIKFFKKVKFFIDKQSDRPSNETKLHLLRKIQKLSYNDC